MTQNDGLSRLDAKLSVGVGWAQLVDDVYNNLPNNVVIADVKEKFAALRVDWYAVEPYPPAAVQGQFSQFLDDIETASQSVCERCGQLGQVRDTGGWLKTLCDTCAAERDAR